MNQKAAKTGTIVIAEHTSEILKNNPLKDPHERKFAVYTPPSYQIESSRRYPVIFGLAGFTGTGENYCHHTIFRQSIPEILDELIAGGMPEVIYAMPNCITLYGGSQYVNSSATGRYEDYLVKEIVPFIDLNFRTTGRRAVMGGSSGGIGAFTLGVKYPDVFSGFADHSGDAAFEYCYFADAPKVISAMEKYDRDLTKFLPSIRERSVPKDDNFMVILNMLAMSACYAPNPEVRPLGFELPFDLHSGELNMRVIEKFFAFDPVRMVAPYLANLKKLSAIWVDCGTKDQYHLHLGSRQLVAQLKKHGITHHYEEYESDHGLLRYEQKRKSIPFLVKALVS